MRNICIYDMVCLNGINVFLKLFYKLMSNP